MQEVGVQATRSADSPGASCSGRPRLAGARERQPAEHIESADGSCAMGDLAYAAWAAAASGLAVVVLKPSTVRPYFSLYGPSWSYRSRY